VAAFLLGMISLYSKSRIVLLVIVFGAMIGTIKLYFSSQRAFITAVSTRVSGDGTARLLISNPGAKEILCEPAHLIQRMNNISSQRIFDGWNVVVPAGKTVECMVTFPRGADSPSTFQLRFHCHRKVKDRSAFLEWISQFSGFLGNSLNRIGNMFNDGKEVMICVRETTYRGHYYEITTPIFTEDNPLSTSVLDPAQIVPNRLKKEQ
jgi:hypothetical protein